MMQSTSSAASFSTIANVSKAARDHESAWPVQRLLDRILIAHFSSQNPLAPRSALTTTLQVHARTELRHLLGRALVVLRRLVQPLWPRFLHLHAWVRCYHRCFNGRLRVWTNPESEKLGRKLECQHQRFWSG